MTINKIERNLTNKTNIINLIFVFIITIYESKSKALSELLIGKTFNAPNIPARVNLTIIQEHACDRKVKLGDYGQLPVVFLNSFPGSGNTWSRALIEDTTGYYSGSIYSEGTMVQNGFVGEFDYVTSGRNIVVKNHGQNEMEHAKGIILVVRNPYDAILADFNRQSSGTHTGLADYSKFKGQVWDDFVKQHTGRWGNMHLWYPTFAAKAEIPIHIIYYEDLKEDVIPEMKKVLYFFKNEFGLVIPDREWRLECLLQHQTKFYRRKKPLEAELFSDEQIAKIDARVKQSQMMFEIYGLPSISDSYYKKKDQATDITRENLADYIESSKIMGKVNIHLDNKRYNVEIGNAIQYYPFQPFKYD